MIDFVFHLLIFDKYGKLQYGAFLQEQHTSKEKSHLPYKPPHISTLDVQTSSMITFTTHCSNKGLETKSTILKGPQFLTSLKTNTIYHEKFNVTLIISQLNTMRQACLYFLIPSAISSKLWKEIMDALSILPVYFHQSKTNKQKTQNEDSDSFGSVIIQEEHQQ